MDPTKLIKNITSSSDVITQKSKEIPKLISNPILSNLKTGISFQLPSIELPPTPVSLGRSMVSSVTSLGASALKSARLISSGIANSIKTPMTDIQRRMITESKSLPKLAVPSQFALSSFLSNLAPLNLSNIFKSNMVSGFFSKSQVEVITETQTKTQEAIESGLSSSNPSIIIEDPYDAFVYADVLGVDLSSFDEEDRVLLNGMKQVNPEDEQQAFSQIASVW